MNKIHSKIGLFINIGNNCKAKNAGKSFSFCTRKMRWMYLLFGLLPVSIGKNGKMYFKLFSLKMLYSVIIFLVSIYVYTKFCVIERFHKILQSRNNFDDFIQNVMFMSFGKTQYFYCIGGWFASTKISDYHNLWSEFEMKFIKKFGHPVRMESLENVCNSVIVICTVGIISLIVGQLFTLSSYTILECIGYIPSCTGCFLYIALMHLHCLAIRMASEQLLRNLELSLAKRVVTQDVIASFRQLWILLSNITQMMGDAFTNYSVILLLGSFIDLIIAGYGYLSHLLKNIKNNESNVFFSKDEIGLMIACLISAYFIIHVTNVCYKATKEVEESFIDVLCVAATKPFHPKLIQEIDMFLVRIKNNPPNISLGGYVTLNRKLATKIFSTTITYLVVLAQFKIGFDQKKESQ